MLGIGTPRQESCSVQLHIRNDMYSTGLQACGALQFFVFLNPSHSRTMRSREPGQLNVGVLHMLKRQFPIIVKPYSSMQCMLSLGIYPSFNVQCPMSFPRLAVGSCPDAPLLYRWKGFEEATSYALRGQLLHGMHSVILQAATNKLPVVTEELDENGELSLAAKQQWRPACQPCGRFFPKKINSPEFGTWSFCKK